MLAFFIGPWEFLILIVILALLFGAKRFAAAGKALGRGAKEFKESVTGEKEEPKELPSPSERERQVS